MAHYQNNLSFIQIFSKDGHNQQYHVTEVKTGVITQGLFA